jgi:hypothetical protein
MKILICGECPDPLTTVAQALNRMRAEQMRSEILLRTPPSSPSLETSSPLDSGQPAKPRVTERP